MAMTVMLVDGVRLADEEGSRASATTVACTKRTTS